MSRRTRYLVLLAGVVLYTVGAAAGQGAYARDHAGATWRTQRCLSYEMRQGPAPFPRFLAGLGWWVYLPFRAGARASAALSGAPSTSRAGGGPGSHNTPFPNPGNPRPAGELAAARAPRAPSRSYTARRVRAGGPEPGSRRCGAVCAPCSLTLDRWDLAGFARWSRIRFAVRGFARDSRAHRAVSYWWIRWGRVA